MQHESSPRIACKEMEHKENKTGFDSCVITEAWNLKSFHYSKYF